ncbi:MAG: repressor LexA, partial [Phormidesmis sp.]
MEPLTQAQQELYDWLVAYIRENRHSPSIRQMMREMKLKSPAPVQSRLDHLRKKGYIDWNEGQARTIRILQEEQGIPIFGAIAAGSMVEAFTDTVEHFDPMSISFKGSDFA